jgi:ferrous iron transport protein B
MPVVPVQANKGKGLDALQHALAQAADEPRVAKGPVFPEAFEAEATALRTAIGEEIEPFLVRRLLLDVGGYTEQRLEERHDDLKAKVQAARQRLANAGCAVPGVEARTRYAWIREACAGCVERPRERPVMWTDRLDRVLTHKLWGTLVFLLLMFVVFQSIFTWAQPLMDLIGNVRDKIGAGLSELLPRGPLTSLIVDGIIRGVGAVVVFLPQILILFGFIAVLEDCGYMARAAYLMDKLMARCGLSGKSFIPMLSSVACAVPGIMATRVIENRRDRFATILVAPLMSCAARLPVYILLIATFLPVRNQQNPDGYPWWTPGLVMFCMYSIGLVVAPLVALVLKRTLLRGETPIFVMEMPMYKLPSLRTVLRRMVDSGWAFLRRAGTLILASMIVVWALLYFPSTDPQGMRYEDRIAELERPVKEQAQELKELEESIAVQQEELDDLKEAAAEHGLSAEQQARQAQLEAEIAPVEEKMKPLEEAVRPVEQAVNALRGEWKSRSILGQLGHAIEPVVKPLGWDWRIGTAALASFPAREVVVGTLGIIYNLGEVDTDEIRKGKRVGRSKLADALRNSRWDQDPDTPVFSVPVALSLMVFFALCCQCASTLAVIRRETNSWRWPVFTFTYMTVLAYVAALAVYQIGSRIGA